MSNKDIYNKWISFINYDKYNKYFLNNEIEWINILQLVKKYINDNNKLPSNSDCDNNIAKLGHWISFQKKNIIEIELSKL